MVVLLLPKSFGPSLRSHCSTGSGRQYILGDEELAGGGVYLQAFSQTLNELSRNMNAVYL